MRVITGDLPHPGKVRIGGGRGGMLHVVADVRQLKRLELIPESGREITRVSSLIGQATTGPLSRPVLRPGPAPSTAVPAAPAPAPRWRSCMQGRIGAGPGLPPSGHPWHGLYRAPGRADDDWRQDRRCSDNQRSQLDFRAEHVGPGSGRPVAERICAGRHRGLIPIRPPLRNGAVATALLRVRVPGAGPAPCSECRRRSWKFPTCRWRPPQIRARATA